MYSSTPWAGVLPATVTPFHPDYSIDEEEVCRTIQFLMDIPGVTGLVCNGHAADSWSLSLEERRRIIQIHLKETRGRIPVVAGVSGQSTREAIRQMEEAKEAGASAVLVVPPSIFRNIHLQGPETAVAFFRDLAKAVDVPIIVFQHPIFRGGYYSPETLAKLTEIENIVAVKETIWDAKMCERDLVALRQSSRRISILLANDTILLPCLALGDFDGLLIGLATLTPHWAVDLLHAMMERDIEKARRINEQLFPIVEMLYYTPGLNTYAAMKEALHMVGVLKNPPNSRPPLRPLGENERRVIRDALEKSGLKRFYETL